MDCHTALFIRQYEIMPIVQCNNWFSNFIETLKGMGSLINKSSYICDELNSSLIVQDEIFF